jgi:hypothetical protein
LYVISVALLQLKVYESAAAAAAAHVNVGAVAHVNAGAVVVEVGVPAVVIFSLKRCWEMQEPRVGM